MRAKCLWAGDTLYGGHSCQVGTFLVETGDEERVSSHCWEGVSPTARNVPPWRGYHPMKRSRNNQPVMVMAEAAVETMMIVPARSVSPRRFAAIT